MADEVSDLTLLIEEEAEELTVVEDGATGVKIVEGVEVLGGEVTAGTEIEVVVVDWTSD
jgi:hypothetical protein